MNMDEWWEIYRSQDVSDGPVPIVSDSDNYEIKPYEGESIPRWKEVLIIVGIILGEILIISFSVFLRLRGI